MALQKLRLLFANTESSASYKLSCSTAFGVLNRKYMCTVTNV